MGDILDRLLLLEGIRTICSIPFPKLTRKPFLIFASPLMDGSEFQLHSLQRGILEAGILATARVLAPPRSFARKLLANGLSTLSHLDRHNFFMELAAFLPSFLFAESDLCVDCLLGLQRKIR